MAVETTPERTTRRLPAIPLIVIFVGVYACAAWLVAPDNFIALVISYFRQMTLLAVIVVVALPIAGTILRPRSPLTMAVEIMRKGGLRLVATAICFCIGMAAFTTFKIAIPTIVPFHADTLLADIDAFLHFGNPGEHLHALIPEWIAGYLVNAYTLVWVSLWFGLLGFIALQRDALLRRHYFWSMAVTMVLLGTVGATLLSSVGPIFYEALIGGTRFAPLMDTVRNGAAGEITFKTAGYLLSAFKGDGDIIGTGISAMPSMHIAIVTLNAVMLTSLNRWIGAAAWGYVLVILTGSVYLGWHYALDGYVSIALVPLIWWSVGRIQRRPAATNGSIQV